ncbi:MAG: hypothetical protein ABS951_06965 [Solibacillus sp.]
MYDFLKAGLYLFVVLVLIGCQKIEQTTSSEAVNNGSSFAFSNEEKPPALTFLVGNIQMKTYRGIYNWSYQDKSTGEIVAIKTESLSPFEMVNIKDGDTLNLSESMHLNFDVTPNEYELRVWDHQTTVSTYTSFDEIKERGNYILEIVGYWDEGRATYVAAVDFQ